ncbi:MAG: NADH-quinone oxidoreductase subunit L [Haliea sp.]|nr:NADH-quinone oxidoreductase subunit L [Haliea sp.]
MTGELAGQWLWVIYAVGFACAWGAGERPWLPARWTARSGLWATLLLIPAGWLWSTRGGPALDPLGLTASALVAVLGWAIVRYSARYLDGDAGQARFVRAMLFTLCMVGILVASSNLAVIVLAWSGTSIGLHYLLTHYPERKAAQVVAHKKFLVSRLAEVCLLIALGLIYAAVGSFSLEALAGHLAGADSLPASLHIAALLVALAVILKTAQLPLHGWLIQVMEAPTPVSALLHAGVVNIGGLVLIRLATLLNLAPAAQTLLVLVGSITAVLAGLVMLTRVSIKVRLAWSTCAQMGFMLVEIGLGLYELALLHLVAHSLYKAYAFLAAGETVRSAGLRNYLPEDASSTRSPAWYLGVPLLTAALVLGSVAAWQWLLPALSVPPAALVILVLGLTALLWLEQGREARLMLRASLQVLALTQLYLLWHTLFAGLAPAPAPAHPGLVAWVLLSFAALYAAQIWLRYHPRGRIARTLFPWAYAGFYLDEAFTRTTFKLWPIRLSPAQAQTLVNRQSLQKGELL